MMVVTVAPRPRRDGARAVEVTPSAIDRARSWTRRTATALVEAEGRLELDVLGREAGPSLAEWDAEWQVVKQIGFAAFLDGHWPIFALLRRLEAGRRDRWD